jgi:hypothetical protein
VVVVHNHDTVVVRMPVMMPAMVVPYDHSLRTSNRRRCDGDRSQRGNNASKLLHLILLLTSTEG